ncbi:MAG: glycosyltransferase family 2 protein [Saprospirales bacterium]|nr:MAG: glycosyltransferase family 2 protein [Saprospirales bacterium]
MGVFSGEIKDKVLIVIPVFNEEGRIGRVVSELLERGYLNVLVVDDGSSDNSSKEAIDAGAFIVRHIINRGAGAATATGMEIFRKSEKFKIAVTMDGDGQHYTEDVIYLMQMHIEQGADITIGDRFSSGKNVIPFRRKVYNVIADLVTGWMSFRMVSDSQSGFRVWSRKAVEKINIEQDGFEFCSEVVIKAHHHGLKISNVPIRVKYTEESMQKGQGFLVGVKTFFNLLHHVLFKIK